MVFAIILYICVIVYGRITKRLVSLRKTPEKARPPVLKNNIVFLGFYFFLLAVLYYVFLVLPAPSGVIYNYSNFDMLTKAPIGLTTKIKDYLFLWISLAGLLVFLLIPRTRRGGKHAPVRLLAVLIVAALFFGGSKLLDAITYRDGNRAVLEQGDVIYSADVDPIDNETPGCRVYTGFYVTYEFDLEAVSEEEGATICICFDNEEIAKEPWEEYEALSYPLAPGETKHLKLVLTELKSETGTFGCNYYLEDGNLLRFTKKTGFMLYGINIGGGLNIHLSVKNANLRNVEFRKGGSYIIKPGTKAVLLQLLLVILLVVVIPFFIVRYKLAMFGDSLRRAHGSGRFLLNELLIVINSVSLFGLCYSFPNPLQRPTVSLMELLLDNWNRTPGTISWLGTASLAVFAVSLVILLSLGMSGSLLPKVKVPLRTLLLLGNILLKDLLELAFLISLFLVVTLIIKLIPILIISAVVSFVARRMKVSRVNTGADSYEVIDFGDGSYSVTNFIGDFFGIFHVL